MLCFWTRMCLDRRAFKLSLLFMEVDPNNLIFWMTLGGPVACICISSEWSCSFSLTWFLIGHPPLRGWFSTWTFLLCLSVDRVQLHSGLHTISFMMAKLIWNLVEKEIDNLVSQFEDSNKKYGLSIDNNFCCYFLKF